MSRTLHVISPTRWIAEVVAESLGPYASQWHIVAHNGLEPVTGIEEADAVWIAPGLLIALNDWRARAGRDPLRFEAPPADWAMRLPEPLLGRAVVTASADDVRRWRGLPHRLGEAPWSQLSNGRVTAFRAARRDLATLQHALVDAPGASTIEMGGHIRDITEEWCVVVHDGVVAASSGYCVHQPPGGSSIATVFEGARFLRHHREAAERVSLEAMRHIDCRSASMLLAYHVGCGEPVVLEVDPVWCASPYPYAPEAMHAFLQTVAAARVLVSGGGSEAPDGNIFQADPWMRREFRNRYRGFAACAQASAMG